jgi:hypothetical protein
VPPKKKKKKREGGECSPELEQMPSMCEAHEEKKKKEEKNKECT